ncbi:MAG: hypothetical protein U0324_41580 [Polyangiales bacterium]
MPSLRSNGHASAAGARDAVGSVAASTVAAPGNDDASSQLAFIHRRFTPP